MSNVRDRLIKEAAQVWDLIDEISRELGKDGQTIEEYRSCEAIKRLCYELQMQMDKTRRIKG